MTSRLIALITAALIYLSVIFVYTIYSLGPLPGENVNMQQNSRQSDTLKPSEFAIVTYYAPQKNASHNVWFSQQLYMQVANKTLSNLARYSHIHGHAFFFMNGNMVDTETRAAYWGKMDVMEYYMNKGYKWILWTDIDVLFMDMKRSIFEEWVLAANDDQHMLFVDECGTPAGPVRSGFFAVRNSPQGRSFLQAWRETFDSFKSNPNPEQEALEGMIKNPQWANISSISSHSKFHTYPHCYDGDSSDAISVHFPGPTKTLVSKFSNRIKNNTLSTDFTIIFPEN